MEQDLEPIFTGCYKSLGPKLARRLYDISMYRKERLAWEDALQEVALAMWEVLQEDPENFRKKVKLQVQVRTERKMSRFYTGQVTGWSRRRPTSEQLMHEEWDPGIPSPTVGDGKAVEKALATLRPAQRDLLRAVLEGNTGAEIARAKGVTTSAVNQSRQYLSLKLKRCLGRSG